MAGIFGPVLVNYIRQYKIDHGVPKAQAYNVTMYVMAVLLVIGFLCNLFIKAVHLASTCSPTAKRQPWRRRQKPGRRWLRVLAVNRAGT